MATPPTSRPPASRAGANALGQQLQAAFGLHAQGRTAEAEAAATQILKIAPKEPNALYLLGILAHQAGDAKTAAQYFEQSYKADRNSVAALSGLGIVRLDQQRHGEAKGLFEKALKLQPGDAMLLNNLGLAQKGAGDLERACKSFEAAFKARPDFAAAAANLADALRKQGLEDEAEQIYRAGLTRTPRDAALNAGLGGLLATAGRMEEALSHFQAAYDAPEARTDVELQRNYAAILIYKGLLRKAEDVLRAACLCAPEDVATLVDLADLLRTEGGEDRAAEAQSLYTKAAEAVERFAARRDAPPLTLHRGATALEQLKRFDEAFALHKRAQAGWRDQAHRQNRRYDRDEIDRFNRATQIVFDRIDAGGADQEGRRLVSDRPVFIVGMPRSGTSLAEQILASHPDVYGAGELTKIPELAGRLSDDVGRAWPEAAEDLTPARADALAEAYLEALPAASKGARYVVDKLPPNFWYVGFIRRLFPTAHIIHSVRHPVDIGLSIFTQRFGHDLLYDHDLEDIAHYFAAYREVMGFWERWDPTMGAVVYERMVADQAGETRRLLDRLGLDWDDRVLAFHETDRDVLTASRLQVRQPIYSTSVEKWRRYETGLAPLLKALGPLADYQAYLKDRGL